MPQSSRIKGMLIRDVRYILYARKSTDNSEKQIQSIDDQVNRLMEMSKNVGLEIVEIITEAKSAKDPGKRPGFNKMIKMIEDGHADGILCWQINRLARNILDSSAVQWMLQQKQIKSIQTIDKEFVPEDNTIFLNLESGMSTQYSLDLSKVVLRGIQGKIDRQEYPGGICPIGYIRDRDERVIIKDPERFKLIRKMWDMMLSGNYTPPKIIDIANTQWGLRTRALKHRGNKTLSRSSIYKIFSNIFYTGLFEWKGEQYPGNHEPMITLEEYDKVQELLGRNGSPRPISREFAFTGFIRCAECGCLYTAEKKKKVLKSTGETKYYTYYHCTRRKKDVKCTQRKNIREEVIEEQIEQILSEITILPEFKDWAVEVLKESNDKEVEERRKIYEVQQKTLNDTQRRLDALLDLRLDGGISNEEYIEKKKMFTNILTKLKANRNYTEDRTEKWMELAEKAFNFATHARQAFVEGDMQTKKEILMTLGKKVRTKDGILEIELNEWLQPIKDGYSALESEYQRLEPEISGSKPGKKDEIDRLCLLWRGRRDSNPRPPA